ncbi:MAG: hypothetical protein A2589_02565 [Candidatus Vogelbacteria bacterium RIFOXYD1_FULL_46_19]|uniref:Uncharacterized protein n=1 Tax=Candidatus Vogelbacteria bacterium RIFOXYD1_FULL_46_19 TaxID=1802439 RepID=A0A1G2QH37_9BACT|nr:MAG: hypothetical protein A2589_02565 [Candidatus Vogelbacteria bacterium RIFOXYD1_FULL_46_19]
MWLLNYVEKVRTYPLPRRRHLLLVWTTGLTLAVIILWLFNLWLVSSASADWWQGLVPAGLAGEWDRVMAGAQLVVDYIVNFLSFR